jgi:drug/metabolite transporter (DMT)-like permease
MLTFVALCLLARFGYSLNDIFIGRLARRQDRVEVAAFRGTSLGVSMAPWLLLVPAAAYDALLTHPLAILLTVGATAAGNILQLHAVRYIPFGLRAAVMICTMAVCSLLIGWSVLDERLSTLQVLLCAVLVASGATIALGSHAHAEIQLDVPRGAALTVGAGALMACAVSGVKFLAHEAHPLLAAWTWEFGAGLILLAPALLRGDGSATTDPLFRRFARVALAALPTAIASGASILALDFGNLGLWGALGGTQILFTAALGALWHRETLGPRRWVLMTVAASAVAGLALAGS